MHGSFTEGCVAVYGHLVGTSSEHNDLQSIANGFFRLLSCSLISSSFGGGCGLAALGGAPAEGGGPPAGC
eukprot:122339-Rhodomonas_salina.1